MDPIFYSYGMVKAMGCKISPAFTVLLESASGTCRFKKAALLDKGINGTRSHSSSLQVLFLPFGTPGGAHSQHPTASVFYMSLCLQ